MDVTVRGPRISDHLATVIDRDGAAVGAAERAKIEYTRSPCGVSRDWRVAQSDALRCDCWRRKRSRLLRGTTPQIVARRGEYVAT